LFSLIETLAVGYVFATTFFLLAVVFWADVELRAPSDDFASKGCFQ
jgi:hypothetical protein